MSANQAIELLLLAQQLGALETNIVPGCSVSIDFSNPNWSKYVRIEGDYDSYEIDKYSELGIPYPESTKSDQGLVISIKAGGTVRVSLQVPPLAYRDIVAYTILYAMDSDLEVNTSWFLGGTSALSRNNLGRNATLPKGNWGRMFNNWFVEFHHSTVWFVIEIHNPSDSSARVVIGVIQVSSIEIHNDACYRLKGWEDVYTVSLNNESFNDFTRLIVPRYRDNIMVTIDISLNIGSNSSASVTVVLGPTGKTIYQRSNITSSTSIGIRIPVYPSSANWGAFETITLSITISASGTVTITGYVIGIYGAWPPKRRSINIDKTVSGTPSAVIYEHTTGFRITYMDLEITNNSSNSVNIEAEIGSNRWIIASIGPGQTKRIYGYLDADRIIAYWDQGVNVSAKGLIIEEEGEIP